MRKNQKRWEILGNLKTRDQRLKTKDILDILLENRGIKTKNQKEEFLNPTPPSKLSLKELKIDIGKVNKAIRRIAKAIKKKEKIIVYGDYDADGICATAILWETLYALKAQVFPFVPDRFSEGYGINQKTIEKLSENNPDLKLIITVDNGIVADKAVGIANKLGIDVVISDHHLKGKRIPKAYSIIHTTEIGGAGLAWVLAREITKKLKNLRTKELKNTLELVAIGTIADQLPLIGQNRSFAKYGLEALNATKRPGLLALFEEAKVVPGNIGTYEVNFMIAPRLNAMGRMVHAIDSLRLLCTTSTKRAKELAATLGKTNKERQKILEEVVLHAKELVTGTKQEKVLVISHESYHEGVIGLAASKLVEEFYRPSIVVAMKKSISKASARSIPGFNIIEAIRKLEGFLLEGGGHPMAAGFSIETKRIEEFTRKFEEASRPLLTDEILTKKLKIDLELPFNQLNWDLVEAIGAFDPTGLGNPTPTFATKKIKVLHAKVVGGDGKHLKLRVEQKSDSFDAIAFGMGEKLTQLKRDAEVDIAYNLEENVWNGNKSLQLKIRDIKI